MWCRTRLTGISITLKTISKFGCRSDSLTRNFYTYLLPHPAFTLSDTVGCGPLTVQASNETLNQDRFTYFWDFGNGQTFTGAQPPAVVLSANPLYGDTVYWVRMTVFSVCDTITVTRLVRVKSGPKALFTPAKTVGCSPMQVTFRNNSRGDNNTYFWDFGDGVTFSTANADAVQHTFVTGRVDTFYVKLKVVNECGTDSVRYAIVVAPNTVRFNVAVNGTEAFGCAPHTVSFINNTSGASTFQWNFGDGNILSTTKNIDTITHTYQSPGRYAVQIRAFNACSDTTATQLIVVYPKPKAAFRIDKNAACIGDSLRFSNLSDSATSYLWKFGDGRTTTLVNPTHRYNAPGLYNVWLVIYRNSASGNVCSDSIMQQVQVSASLPGTFTARDTASQCAPFTATFINQNRPSVTATWDFGDGTTGTGDSVVHTYTAFGTYPVQLTVTVPGGCTYTSRKTVTVAGLGGTLRYTGGYVCPKGTVQLQAVASNTDTYVWDFGDGTTQSTAQQTVYHQYRNPGVYLPSVKLQNSAGCVFPLKGTDSIKVDRILAGFTATQQVTCGTTTVRFADTSHVFFGKNRVHWNFGDGTTGTGGTNSHQYTASGTYPVEMILFSNSGCSDTVRRQVAVQVNSKPAASINAVTASCTRNPSTLLVVCSRPMQ
jgi:PKD repeat protein